MKINVLDNIIFDKKQIISGVTKVNKDIFPETGISFNLNDHRGIFNFNEHLGYLANAINFNESRIKYVDQVHSDIIVEMSGTSEVCKADAMITTEKNLILMIRTADCAGILIYDSTNEVIAAVHSGWKGTQLNITGKTLTQMINRYGCNPDDLLIYISPCASGRNYEVGEDVAQFFPNSITKLSANKFLFDNTKEILEQISVYGIPMQNIEIANVCSIENKDFHSYRRDGVNAGRMGVFIGMID